MQNAFEVLEEKVKKAAGVVQRLRDENKAMSEELGRLRPRLESAEKAMSSLQKDRGASAEETKKTAALAGEVETLRKEREEIRQRIARMVSVLDSLED